MDAAGNTLGPLFRAVGAALRANQDELNSADTFNGNHGDHMVQVFEIAAQAVDQPGSLSLADAMQAAAQQLAEQPGNGSARIYALGLDQMAQQFRRYNITLNDLLGYVSTILEENTEPGSVVGERSGDALKALVSGLVGWKSAAQNQAGSGADQDPAPWYLSPSAGSGSLDMNALFDLGVVYMQAKARNSERSQVLADAAASASPLSQIPHRYQSGKLAIRSLLEALRRQGQV